MALGLCGMGFGVQGSGFWGEGVGVVGFGVPKGRNLPENCVTFNCYRGYGLQGMGPLL